MRKIFTLFALFSAFVFTAKAETVGGDCTETLQWSYNTDTKTLTFTGTGAMPDYLIDETPWAKYKNKVEKVELSSQMTVIGTYAFHWFEKLTSIVIPQSVKEINQYSFQYCIRLNSVQMGNEVFWIGSHAFADCYSLTTLSLPASLTATIDPSHGPGYRAFAYVCNVAYADDHKKNYDARCVNGIVEEPMVYQDADKTILAACSAVAKGYVRVPNGVKTINPEAFYNCFDVITVELPNSVETVEKYAFDECTSIKTLIIGSGLQSTSMYSFSMASLKTVVCFALTPPDLGMNSFYDTKEKEAVLYVPDESVNAYKEADQWKDFGTIKPISEMPAGIVIGEGIDNISTATPANKIIRDGVILIERNGRTYTTSGQEIK